MAEVGSLLDTTKMATKFMSSPYLRFLRQMQPKKVKINRQEKTKTVGQLPKLVAPSNELLKSKRSLDQSRESRESHQSQ